MGNIVTKEVSAVQCTYPYIRTSSARLPRLSRRQTNPRLPNGQLGFGLDSVRF